jgi:hypothetical protein
MTSSEFIPFNQTSACRINNFSIDNNVVTIKESDMGKNNNYNPGF